MRREDRILVVEDNPAITDAIGDRFACDTASDGWDAIDKLERGDYAAIVIDADLPRQSGYGVLTYLREEVGDDVGNVIFLTSSSHDAVRRKFGSALHVVDKQDAVDELTRVLSE
jgi:DNA-binding response OmpR family regulator